MKVYYAVIDTNVLVSAMLNIYSVPGQLYAETMNGRIIPILNDKIWSEYVDVLRRPKFRFEFRAVNVFLDEIKRRAVYSDTADIEDVVIDPKDVIFYAVLMEKRKEEEAYLITGNLKHFPAKTYIVTPREMLDMLKEDESEQ